MNARSTHAILCLWFVACTGDGTASDATDATDGFTDSDTGTSVVKSLAPFGSGTRLQAATLDGGGADAQIFQHWVDTELGVDCAVAFDGDGIPRCMPTDFGQFVYADDACTEPLLAWRTCDKDAEPPALVSSSLPDRCIGERSAAAYQIGTSVKRTHVYEGRDCTRTELESPRDYFQATLRPSSDFVSFTRRTVPVGDGLGVEVLETAGGAHLLSNTIALEPGQVCFPIHLGKEGTERCLHGDFAYDFGGLHTSKTCEGDSLAYTIGAARCDPPAYALSYGPRGACELWTAGLATIGDSVEWSEVYAQRGDQCVAAVEDSRAYYEVGGGVSDDAIPALEVAPFGTSRLRPRMYTTSSGDPLVPIGSDWWDETLGKDCVAYSTSSDGMRCLPELWLADPRFGTFADASCTQRVMSQSTDPCFGSDLPELFGVTTGAECGDQAIEEIRSVGAEHTGDVWRKSGESCTPLTPGEATAYHRVGDLVPLSDYARITRTP